MKLFVRLAIIIFNLTLYQNRVKAQDIWAPIEGSLMTRWSEKVDPMKVLPEYPRPNLVREDWINLNGLWNYAITELNEQPESFHDKILVPFPIESSLSGVKKSVSDSEFIWYKREFKIPSAWNNKRIILHFEAVDWHTKVWVNEVFVGEHRGGYDPFSFDITDMLSMNERQYLTVSVWDPTDKGTQPCGKQVQNPGGIFYTSTSGIWQTVWLEPVDKLHIEDYSVTSNIDNNTASFIVKCSIENEYLTVNIIIRDSSEIVSQYSGKVKDEITLHIDQPKLWSPDNPFLYDVEIQLLSDNKLNDQIKGYFGMRKVSLGNDSEGRPKIKLNNEFVFQNGPLDQGFWPDGIYTAPTDEALKFDIEITKELGFNMLRKHVKIESRRFYYWCDKLGVLVWQDMPSGDQKIGPEKADIIRSTESAEQFEWELKKMVETHFNNPSIIMWIPFNEGWGQYDTKRIVQLLRNLDPSRLVSNTSGWSDRGIGDIYDIHNYPEPRLPEAQKERAIVLGEFGGIGLRINDHVWTDDSWGYVSFTDKNDFITSYEDYYSAVWDFAEDSALSAAVYTQLTDVETEVNGLLTYDREIVKYDKHILRGINTNNYLRAPKILPSGGYFNIGDKAAIVHDNPSIIYYTINGKDPHIWDRTYHNEIVLISDVIIKAKAIDKDKQSRTVSASFKKTHLKGPEYKYPYSEKYKASGDFALLNNKEGTLNFRDGNWQGFHGSDLEVIIKIDDSNKIDEIKINFLEDLDHWIFLPKSVEFSSSNNGKNFETLDRIKIDQPLKMREKSIKIISLIPKNKNFKYLKISAENILNCPDWHQGKGRKAWLFTDEIKITEK